MHPIKRALTVIENYHESALGGKNPTGHIFALKNRGWTDRTETVHSGTIGHKLDDLSPQQIKDELNRLRRKKTIDTGEGGIEA